MKVYFYSVAVLAAVGSLIQTSHAVPLHTMTTNQTETGVLVNLTSLGENGDTGKPVSFNLGPGGDSKNISLTSSFTPKGSSNSSCPVTKPACGTCAKFASGGRAESALHSLVKETNSLTSALMDKMAKDVMGGDPPACTIEDRLEQGFEISLDDFEVGGIVTGCKPEPPKKCDCPPPQNAVLTIKQTEDECGQLPKCPCSSATPATKAADSTTSKTSGGSAPSTSTDGSKSTTASTVVKSAPTPAQKQADQKDAIKKLEQAKA